MSHHETPVAFTCGGDTLIGIVHAPESGSRVGVLAMAAGGPQYRAGCCRQLLYLGRRLADEGISVMRFDYRGLGDASGPFAGFQSTRDDIRSAIDAFKRQQPELEHVILWGGCDAASASMIFAHGFPEVSGLILGNPYAHSEETGERAMVKHYYWQRLKEPAFWKKLLSFKFNPLPALATVGRVLKRKLAPTSTEPADSSAPRDESALPFQTRMRLGMARFEGHVLLLMSGRSLVSKEFDEMTASDARWSEAFGACGSHTRHNLPDADQAFSTIAARDEIITVAEAWIKRQWPKA